MSHAVAAILVWGVLELVSFTPDTDQCKRAGASPEKVDVQVGDVFPGKDESFRLGL